MNEAGADLRVLRALLAEARIIVDRQLQLLRDLDGKVAVVIAAAGTVGGVLVATVAYLFRAPAPPAADLAASVGTWPVMVGLTSVIAALAFAAASLRKRGLALGIGPASLRDLAPVGTEREALLALVGAYAQGIDRNSMAVARASYALNASVALFVGGAIFGSLGAVGLIVSRLSGGA